MIEKLVLGSAQFGIEYGINNSNGKPSQNQAFKMLEYAASKNIRTIDTADAYGNATEIIGEFIKSHQATLSINSKFNSNKELLSFQLANSLQQLGLDKLDTYFYHNFNDLVSHPGLMRQMVSLKTNGLIKQIGVSVYTNLEFKTAINFADVDVIQFPFNLLDNRYQRGEQMKQAKLNGKKLQARSIFLQGLIFKPLETIPIKLAPLKPYLESIQKLSNEFNMGIDKMALLYVLQQNEIDKVIIGVDNIEQLKENIKIGQQILPFELIEKINQIEVLDSELLYPINWN